MLILERTFAFSDATATAGATSPIRSSNFNRLILLSFARLHPRPASCLSWRLQMSKGYFPIMQRAPPVTSALARRVSEYFSRVRKP